jgi:hypothetical protein
LGDGNSLCRRLALLLEGDENQDNELRESAVGYVCEDWNGFSEFLRGKILLHSLPFHIFLVLTLVVHILTSERN